MNIHTFTVNPLQENTYLVSRDNRGFVVDPGFFSATEIDLFNRKVTELGVRLEAIVLTHAHLDHVFGVERVRDHYGEIPVYLHRDDAWFWDNYMLSAARFGFEVKPFGFQPDWIDGGEVEFAGIGLKALFTPGHAPGHLAYYHPESGQLLSGDALFRESIGRTDLPMGNFEQLEGSIKTNLYTLPDCTVVYPGHGPATTIGHEKKHNPFVRY